MTTNFSI
jgi:hypothetical protein